MDRQRKLLSYEAVAPVLSPVQEVSPSPATVRGDLETMANNELKPNAATSKNVEYSFTDHLMERLEQYREQAIRAEKQLRLERQKNEELETKINFFKTEYNNYRLSWTMDQAEIRELKARVVDLEAKSSFYKTEYNNYRLSWTMDQAEIRELNAKVTDHEAKIKIYKTEYNNYRLSWTMDQAEIQELKNRVVDLESSLEQKNRNPEVIEKREKGDGDLQGKKGHSPDESKHDDEPCQTEIMLPVQKPENISTVQCDMKTTTRIPVRNTKPVFQKEGLQNVGATQASFVPRPPSKGQPKTGHRRPNVAKPRDAHVLKLPVINTIKVTNVNRKTSQLPNMHQLYPLSSPQVRTRSKLPRLCAATCS